MHCDCVRVGYPYHDCVCLIHIHQQQIHELVKAMQVACSQTAYGMTMMMMTMITITTVVIVMMLMIQQH